MVNCIIVFLFIFHELVVLSTGKNDSPFFKYIRRLNRKTVPGTDLEKCVLVGDPHIQMFHPVDQWPSSYKDCLDEGTLTAVRNSIVTILIDVHDWWMVDVRLYASVLKH